MNRCQECNTEFEPKTPILYKKWDIEHKLVDAKPMFATYAFHVGCWERWQVIHATR